MPSSSWLVRKITEESQSTEEISVPTCLQVHGLSGKLRRNRKIRRKPPYQHALKSSTCQENYGGIAKYGGNIRTDLLSSLWLARRATEKMKKIEETSVPAYFRAFGLPGSLRRNHKKLSILPYKLAFAPLACQDHYGEIAKNGGYLRTQAVPANSSRLFRILNARRVQKASPGCERLWLLTRFAAQQA